MGNRVGMARAGLYAGGAVLVLLAGTFGFVLAGGAVWGWLAGLGDELARVPGQVWVGLLIAYWVSLQFDKAAEAIEAQTAVLKQLQADIHRLVELVRED